MTTSKPTQQQVRDYLNQRHTTQEAPPTPERIREMLGWKLIRPEPR